MSVTWIAVSRSLTEDLLFWPSLARTLARRNTLEPVILVHRLGENAARALEAAGFEVGAGEALLSANPGAELVRAAREESRKIVGDLSEEGVSVVGFLGSDRHASQLVDGVVEFRSAEWLRQVAAQGTIVSMATLAAGDDGAASEWGLADGIAEWARPGETVVALTARKMPPEEVIPAQEANIAGLDLSLLIQAGLNVRISGVSGLAAGASTAGVSVVS